MGAVICVVRGFFGRGSRGGSGVALDSVLRHTISDIDILGPNPVGHIAACACCKHVIKEVYGTQSRYCPCWGHVSSPVGVGRN